MSTATRFAQCLFAATKTNDDDDDDDDDNDAGKTLRTHNNNNNKKQHNRKHQQKGERAEEECARVADEAAIAWPPASTHTHTRAHKKDNEQNRQTDSFLHAVLEYVRTWHRTVID